MKKLMFLIVAATIFFGCDDQTPKQPDPPVRQEDPATEDQAQNSELPVTEKINRIIDADEESMVRIVANATETLKIGSNSFLLEAYLWRDFMPGWGPDFGPDGRSMISINRLVDVNYVAIPGNITLVKQYVIYEGMIWESEYENEASPEQSPHKIEKVSRYGPKWGPKIQVDVIAEVRDSKSEKSYHIKCENIYVIRTD